MYNARRVGVYLKQIKIIFFSEVKMDLMWLFTVPVLKLAIKIALSISSIFLVVQVYIYLLFMVPLLKLAIAIAPSIILPRYRYDITNKAKGIRNIATGITNKATGTINNAKAITNKATGTINNAKGITNKATGITNKLSCFVGIHYTYSTFTKAC